MMASKSPGKAIWSVFKKRRVLYNSIQGLETRFCAPTRNFYWFEGRIYALFWLKTWQHTNTNFHFAILPFIVIESKLYKLKLNNLFNWFRACWCLWLLWKGFIFRHSIECHKDIIIICTLLKVHGPERSHAYFLVCWTTILGQVSHWSTILASSSVRVQTTIVFRALPREMSLLRAIKAKCIGERMFWIAWQRTFSQGVFFWSASITNKLLLIWCFWTRFDGMSWSPTQKANHGSFLECLSSKSSFDRSWIWRDWNGLSIERWCRQMLLLGQFCKSSHGEGF